MRYQIVWRRGERQRAIDWCASRYPMYARVRLKKGLPVLSLHEYIGKCLERTEQRKREVMAQQTRNQKRREERELDRAQGLSAAPGGVSTGTLLVGGGIILGIGYLLTRGSSKPSSGGSSMTTPEQQSQSILGAGSFAESKNFRVGRANVGPMDGPKFKAALQAMADGPRPGWIDSVQYSDLIVKASKAKNVSPFAVASLGAHESRWGRALTPPGPGGNGDYGAREMGDRSSPPAGCKVVNVLPPGWTPGRLKDRKTGLIRDAQAPWYIPIDEKGFGRGLLQLDVVASGLGAMPGWQDPETAIGYGAQVLKGKFTALQQLVPGLKGIDLMVSALEAYNFGENNVAANIKAGKPISSGNPNGAYAATYILPAMQDLETNFIDVQGGGQVSV